MRKLFHALLANHCALCDAACATFLCAGCEAHLPRVGDACPVCALPLAHEASLCADCLELPKPFTSSLCPFVYTYPLDGLIRRFKHRRYFAAGEFLAKSLGACVRLHYDQLPDALVPMPQHWRRRLLRGFNQAHFLADQLSAQTRIPVLPLVGKTRPTPSQQGLDRKQRLRNLHDVFAVRGAVQGKHLLLVDDVMTTGASAMSLAEALLKAGARRVDVAVLARTPKPA